MMSNLSSRLSRLEIRLQTLIEGGAGRLFPVRSMPQSLAYHLAKALQSKIQIGPDGSATAPNLFTLLLHPDHCRILQADRTILDDLAHSLQQAGSEAGLQFLSPPVVQVSPSNQLELGEVQVLAQNSQEDLPETASMQVAQDDSLEVFPKNAYLVVDGTQVYPLAQNVVNIGRRSDNQLVIDDPRVSRLHAQLRLVKGRFMIFDLGSAGGTWVNGERVHQTALYPGDVISLAGVSLVFGQDTAEQSETQEYIVPDR